MFAIGRKNRGEEVACTPSFSSMKSLSAICISEDTEGLERFHKEVVKEPLSGISNQAGSRTLECAKYLLKRTHAEGLMHKVDLTDQMAGGNDEGHEDGVCSVIWNYRAKNFRWIEIVPRRRLKSFQNSSDAQFSGFPFLHPHISLNLLFEVFAIYRKQLTGRIGCAEELACLRFAFRKHLTSSKFILSEGVKCR